MIIIDNYRDNNTVCHSLVLFKGQVKNVEHGEVVIAVNGKKQLSWPVICYAFRALVQLEEGVNKIVLHCSRQTNTIRLNYERDRRTRFVRLVYIVCLKSTGEFQGPCIEDRSVESACQKITFGAKVIQSVTAEKVKDCGLVCRTFKLEEDHKGKAICHVFHSKLTVEETHAMKEQALWDQFAMELMNSKLRTDKCKFLAFLSSTRYAGARDGVKTPLGHLQVRARTRGHVALGGGGLALIGTGCLYTWPSGLHEFQKKLEDVRPVDTSQFMDDSCNRHQLWACYISTLGASLHELAHTFDVGHSRQGIMGLGFHQLQQELQVYEQKKCCVCTRNERAHFQEKLFTKDNRQHKLVLTSGPAIEPKHVHWIVPCLHCPDGPFWNTSTAWILAHNKWFLMDEETSTPLIWENTSKGWLVTSCCGVVVAELRDSTGLVLAYWHPEKTQNPPLTVHLPKGPLSWKAQSMVVQDIKGNLLKIDLPSAH